MKLQTASAMLLLAASGVASAQPSDIARDHDSILAMQGEYTVDFAFDETVLLKPGYERAPAMRSGGSEVVIVVENTPKRIVLQHLLLDEKSGHITKHWRQDWVYEAPNRFEFSADQTWKVRSIPSAVNQGAWTQVRVRSERRTALLRHRHLDLHQQRAELDQRPELAPAAAP